MSDCLHNFESIRSIQAKYRNGTLSPVEFVESFLQRIAQRQGTINAYVTVIAEEARQKAKEAEAALKDPQAKLGPLHGIPICLKDLLDHKKGVRHSFGCLPLADHISQFTTTCVKRLESAGAIVLGKTNTPEFGHKGVTDNRIIGPTSTPFKPGYNSGGSSGGSAAAVADGQAVLGLGSDGGGSIRIPASWCGTFGYKATFGRVPFSNSGLGFWSTPFVFNGPITRRVEDAAIAMSVLQGPDPMEPMMLPAEDIDYLAAMQGSVKGWRIAYSPDLGCFPVDPEVKRVVEEAASSFEGLEATVEEVSVNLKHPQQVLADTWSQLIGVLSATFNEEFLKAGVDFLGEHRHQLPEEYLSNIELGQRTSAIEYRQLDTIRLDVFHGIQTVLQDYDLLLCPTLAVPPVKNATEGDTLGPREVNGEEVDPCIGWCLTYPQNFTGHPAASIPAGLTTDGLPIGMQMVGPMHGDAKLFTAAANYERVRPWLQDYPALQTMVEA